jgi:hypothetical protein
LSSVTVVVKLDGGRAYVLRGVIDDIGSIEPLGELRGGSRTAGWALASSRRFEQIRHRVSMRCQ